MSYRGYILELPVGIKVGPSENIFIQEAFKADVTHSRIRKKYTFELQYVEKFV